MKMIRKYAIYTGHTVINGERTDTFDCPNRKCGREVLEDYTCCPWCGQKLKFQTAAERVKERPFSVGMYFPDPLNDNPFYKQGKYDH